MIEGGIEYESESEALVPNGRDLIAQRDPWDFSDIPDPETPKRITLPAMMGDYRPVEGMPGLWMRPMRMRQEAQAMDLYAAIGAATAGDAVRTGAAIAALVLYRLTLPNDPEEARAAVAAHVRGGPSIFEPLTEQEVLDRFDDVEHLTRLVLAPLGIMQEGALSPPAVERSASPTGGD